MQALFFVVFLAIAVGFAFFAFGVMRGRWSLTDRALHRWNIGTLAACIITATIGVTVLGFGAPADYESRLNLVEEKEAVLDDAEAAYAPFKKEVTEAETAKAELDEKIEQVETELGGSQELDDAREKRDEAEASVIETQEPLQEAADFLRTAEGEVTGSDGEPLTITPTGDTSWRLSSFATFGDDFIMTVDEEGELIFFINGEQIRDDEGNFLVLNEQTAATTTSGNRNLWEFIEPFYTPYQEAFEEFNTASDQFDAAIEEIAELEEDLDPQLLAEKREIEDEIIIVDQQLASAVSDASSFETDVKTATTGRDEAVKSAEESDDWLITAGAIATIIALAALAAVWFKVSPFVAVSFAAACAAGAVLAAPQLDNNITATAVVHRAALFGVGAVYILALKQVFRKPNKDRYLDPERLAPAKDLAQLIATYLAVATFSAFANAIASAIGVNDQWITVLAVIPFLLLGLALFLLQGVPVARAMIKLSRWSYGNRIAPHMMSLADRNPRLATFWLFMSPWSAILAIFTPVLILFMDTGTVLGLTGVSNPFSMLTNPVGDYRGVLVVSSTLFGGYVFIWALSFIFKPIHRQGLRWWRKLWDPKIAHKTVWSELVEATSVEERRNCDELRLLVHAAMQAVTEEELPYVNRWWIGLVYPSMEAVAVESDRPLLLIGSTGSGKTTSIVYQNAMLHDGPQVITSTKDELMNNLATGFINNGKPCYVFDPLGTVVTTPPGVKHISWNMLTGCKSWETARKRSTLIIGAANATKDASQNSGSSFWEATAAEALTALLYGCAITDRDLMALVSIVSSLGVGETPDAEGEPTTTAFGKLGDDIASKLYEEELQDGNQDLIDELHLCFRGLEQIVNVMGGGGEIGGSLQVSIARGVSALRSATALRVLKDTTNLVDVPNVVDTNGVIFLVSETADQELTAPLFVGLIDEVVQETYRRNRNGIEVETLLLLDELAQLAPLKNLPNLVAEGRGKGLRILAVLQDLEQAATVWGFQGRAFPSKFPYMLVLPGVRDREFLSTLETLAGQYDHWYTTRSVSQTYSKDGGSFSTSMNENKERRSYLEAGDIAAMQYQTALLFAINTGLYRGWANIWLTATWQQHPYPQPFNDFLDQPPQNPTEIIDLDEDAQDLEDQTT